MALPCILSVSHATHTQHPNLVLAYGKRVRAARCDKGSNNQDGRRCPQQPGRWGQ